MNDVSTDVGKIKAGIHDMFPETAGLSISQDTLLNDIPGWDSMAAVNLQAYLQEAFGVSVPEEILSGDASIMDVISHMRNS